MGRPNPSPEVQCLNRSNENRESRQEKLCLISFRPQAAMGMVLLSPPEDKVGGEEGCVLQVGIRGRGIPSPRAERDRRALQRVSSIPGRGACGKMGRA